MYIYIYTYICMYVCVYISLSIYIYTRTYWLQIMVQMPSQISVRPPPHPTPFGIGEPSFSTAMLRRAWGLQGPGTLNQGVLIRVWLQLTPGLDCWKPLTSFRFQEPHMRVFKNWGPWYRSRTSPALIMRTHTQRGLLVCRNSYV